MADDAAAVGGRRKRCPYCKRLKVVGAEIAYQQDRYDLEVNFDESERWICHDCESMRADEI